MRGTAWWFCLGMGSLWFVLAMCGEQSGLQISQAWLAAAIVIGAMGK